LDDNVQYIILEVLRNTTDHRYADRAKQKKYNAWLRKRKALEIDIEAVFGRIMREVVR
jgi:hypothetical protein